MTPSRSRMLRALKRPKRCRGLALSAEDGGMLRTERVGGILTLSRQAIKKR